MQLEPGGKDDIPVAIPATGVLPSICVVVATFAFENSGQEMGQRWLPNAEKKIVDPRKDTCGKGAGGRHHDRWKEGMDL